MKIKKIIADFYKSEAAGGVTLLACALLSMLLVNLFFRENFAVLLQADLAGRPVAFWINEVLMTVFFLIIGFEIERELYVGELSKIKKALLPVFAALGGMIFPAVIYLCLNAGGDVRGFGIPVATDIAFSIAVLTLLSLRLPPTLKVFLSALAIIDDLGAIIVIAVFYTADFSFWYFLAALGVYGVLILFNRLKINNLFFYLIPGIAVWILLFSAGVHPTITGVLLAFAIPFQRGGLSSPSCRLQKLLHKPTAFFILPLFAFTNTGILFSGEDLPLLLSPNALGIMLGLFIGKPLGITLFSWLAVKTRVCSMFENLSWKHILGAGMVAGIGFTMSIFITFLAFDDPEMIKVSKIAVFTASLVSATAGILFLTLTNRRRREPITLAKRIHG
jgi:NhaA family Na+:H+ antiporter